jgi:hypothetical protein
MAESMTLTGSLWVTQAAELLRNNSNDMLTTDL